MRISDWSSDVCSSDLLFQPILPPTSDDDAPTRSDELLRRRTAAAGCRARDEGCPSHVCLFFPLSPPRMASPSREGSKPRTMHAQYSALMLDSGTGEPVRPRFPPMEKEQGRENE